VLLPTQSTHLFTQTFRKSSREYKLLNSVSSSTSVEIEAAVRDMDSDDHHILTTHKAPLEMYALLINWISSAAEAVKTPGEGGAAASKPKVRMAFQLLPRPLKGFQRGRSQDHRACKKRQKDKHLELGGSNPCHTGSFNVF